MEEQTPSKLDFIDVVSNFGFEILIHTEKYPKGMLKYSAANDDWFFDRNEDYWDFDIKINGYKAECLISNRKKIQYANFLNQLYFKFIENHSNLESPVLSKAGYVNQLNFEIGKLSRINQLFYIDLKPEGDIYLARQKVQLNRSITFTFSRKEDVYDDDILFYKCIDSFVSCQKEVIESAISFLNKKLEEVKLSYNQILESDTPSHNPKQIVWKKSDTDLLELVTALDEMEAIGIKGHDLTRKDAIEFFSNMLGKEIKDAESKLSRATERKKDVSPFLSALKESFDNYAIKKEQK